MYKDITEHYIRKINILITLFGSLFANSCTSIKQHYEYNEVQL